MEPWLAEFDQLGPAGFRLEFVPGECKPLDLNPLHPVFKEGGLFFWEGHPRATVVEQTFLEGMDVVPNRLLGEALGYPSQQVCGDRMFCAQDD